jgi:hypothetical protein
MAANTGTKARDDLTLKQRRLFQELEEIALLLRLDYQGVKSYKRDARTPLLEMMRRKLILSEVITSYTLTDEHLNVRIAHFFFGRQRSFSRLWRTRRFRLFNYHVLEELPLMAKLRFVKSFSRVPKSVASDIERLNLGGHPKPANEGRLKTGQRN